MFLNGTIEIDDEGLHRQLIASIQTGYTDIDYTSQKWKKTHSLINEGDKYWEEDEPIKAKLYAKRKLVEVLNDVRRDLWIAEADGTTQKSSEEVRVIREALKEAQIMLEEHSDLDEKAAEEFLKEKGLFSGDIAPNVDIFDPSLVHELPSWEGELKGHDEL